jgi:hypothetical protein
MSLEEAIRTGVLDLQKGLFIDPVSGDVMSLVDAIKEQKIDPVAASHDLAAVNQVFKGHRSINEIIFRYAWIYKSLFNGVC